MNENETKDLSTGATPVVEGVEVVTLDYPIKRGDTEVKEITLRKPMAGQLRGVKLTELGTKVAGFFVRKSIRAEYLTA